MLAGMDIDMVVSVLTLLMPVLFLLDIANRYKDKVK
jgi:hypothetical protein